MRILFLAIALLTADSSWACRGQSPDPWFEIDVSFKEKGLPKGVSLIRQGSMFFLANSTAKELVVLKPVPDARMRAVREKMKLDPAFIHEYKSVSGKAFRCVMESDSSCWTPEGVYDPIAPGAVEARPFPELKQVYRDARPADVKIPSAHPVAIDFEYDGKKSRLVGQAKYKLNSKYDPEAGAKGVKQLKECENAKRRSE